MINLTISFLTMNKSYVILLLAIHFFFVTSNLSAFTITTEGTKTYSVTTINSIQLLLLLLLF